MRVKLVCALASALVSTPSSRRSDLRARAVHRAAAFACRHLLRLCRAPQHRGGDTNRARRHAAHRNRQCPVARGGPAGAPAAGGDGGARALARGSVLCHRLRRHDLCPAGAVPGEPDPSGEHVPDPCRQPRWRAGHRPVHAPHRRGIRPLQPVRSDSRAGGLGSVSQRAARAVRQSWPRRRGL